MSTTCATSAAYMSMSQLLATYGDDCWEEYIKDVRVEEKRTGKKFPAPQVNLMYADLVLWREEDGYMVKGNEVEGRQCIKIEGKPKAKTTRPRRTKSVKDQKGTWQLTVGVDKLASIYLVPEIVRELVYECGFRELQSFYVTLASNVSKQERPRLDGMTKILKPKYYFDGVVGHDIRVKGVAWNDKCACLVVDIGDTECCNTQPHITLALAPDVPPGYSNEMLSSKDYTFTMMDCVINGVLEFHQFS